MPGDVTTTPSVSTGVARRAALTAGAVALLVAGERVPLPFIEWDEFRLLARYGLAFKLLTPLALGVMPFFSAFLLVEYVAEVVPRLRRLRHGPAADRAPLTRSAWTLALVLAAMQGWGIATYLQTLRDTHGYPLLGYGLGSVLGVTGALVLGTIVAGCVALLVSRHGLGNGFAVLFAAGAVETVLQLGNAMLLQPTRVWSDAAAVVGLALVVAVPLVVARQRRLRTSGPRVPVPTCGLAVLEVPDAFLAFPTMLASWFPWLSSLAKALRPDAGLYTCVRLALAAVLALFLARLFCAPDAVVRAFHRAAPEQFDEEAAAAVRRSLAVANRRSLALVMGLVLIPTVATSLGVPVSISVHALFSVALLIAVVWDLQAEVRARTGSPSLVTAWSLHRVYTVEPALEALAAAGITGFARTRHYRALFHFFAPYAPIEILVSPERQVEAEAICARIAMDVTAAPR